VDLLFADRTDGMNGGPKLFEIACATVALLEVLLESGLRGGVQRTVQIQGDQLDHFLASERPRAGWPWH
jgi:hypothetical protein